MATKQPTFLARFGARPLPRAALEEWARTPPAYTSWWARALGAMFLSGRVTLTTQGVPNRTDLNRVCKEANFNQHLAERVGQFLLAGAVLQRDGHGTGIVAGPNAARFWSGERAALAAVATAAVVNLIQEHTGHVIYRPQLAIHAHLIEFLKLFFHHWNGLSLVEDQLGPAMHALASLPAAELKAQCRELALDQHVAGGWHWWLDQRGQVALRSALYCAEWAGRAGDEQPARIVPTPLGLAMLGLGPLPESEPLSTELRVLPNLAVFAGAGRPLEELALLCRHCKIQRLDRVLEFQIDRKRLQQTSGNAPAGSTLRALFAEQEPLPATVLDALGTRSVLSGTVGYRICHALIKPPSEEVLQAIRQHPRLKGFIEAGAPPGYLLLKPTANPATFLQRCQELGLKLEQL